MKTLVPIAVLLLSFAAQAKCDKKIDPNKVILFVDTNNSELEIATTEKAACERGERVVVVPKNYKDYTKHTNAVAAVNKKVEKCVKDKKDCTAIRQEAQKVGMELHNLIKSNKTISEQTKEALDEIKKSGGKLKNVTISGHDGGGQFGGYKGSFGRYEFSEMMKGYQDINEVKSLLLLGCYTGVPKEVIEWKHIFPDVKIIAGYDGSAPLSDKPAGHQYISDILLKEKKLLENADQTKLQNYAKQNIQGLSMMNAAMYLNCNDGTKDAEFYFGSLKEGKSFRNFDIKECEDKRPELEVLIAELDKYASGELEVPKDTSGGALRQLYNQARRIEHCGELLNMSLNVNTAFNLLFYEAVKQNFANLYKDDLEQAEKILSDLKIEDFEAGFNKAADEQNKNIEELKAKIELLDKDPEKAIAEEKKKLDEMAKNRDALFNDPKYAQVKNYIDPATAAYSGPMDLAANLVPLAQELMNVSMNYNIANYQFEALKANPAGLNMTNRQMVTILEQNLTNQRLLLEKIKEDIGKPENKVWIPTAKNLKEKSRKETMINLHRASAMLAIPGLPDKQRQALTWLVHAGGTHLSLFQNPFSWHEYTGRTEEPQFPIRLEQMNGTPFYGFGGEALNSFNYGSIAGGAAGGYMPQRENAETNE